MILKIQNPTTKNKIFIPGGSDNDNDYVGEFYQAAFTEILIIIIIIFTVTSDHRTISQFRKIIEYDENSYIRNFLHSFTSR